MIAFSVRTRRKLGGMGAVLLLAAVVAACGIGGPPPLGPTLSVAEEHGRPTCTATAGPFVCSGTVDVTVTNIGTAPTSVAPVVTATHTDMTNTLAVIQGTCDDAPLDPSASCTATLLFSNPASITGVMTDSGTITATAGIVVGSLNYTLS